jgi:Na+-translocating ferredoxin:NAD+ oxidoreductase subunit D
MNQPPATPPPGRLMEEGFAWARESPFHRAPEEVRTIYRVTMAAASLPLLGGLAWFGWRSAVVTAIAVVSCALTERLYYRVIKAPAMLGRSHAYLTGLLLALTLPATAPWHVPALAGVFAIIVGKAVFGGVGHFLWQPALVGRLAVGVFFASSLNPDLWPVLAPGKLLWGDVSRGQVVEGFHRWRGQAAPPGNDAILSPAPADILAGLTRDSEPRFSGLAYLPEGGDIPASRPTLLSRLPPVEETLLGARGGGIGETSIALILIGGLYLLYRNYVKWQLPAAMLAAAAAVALVAPVRLAGAGGPVTAWWPGLAEGGEVAALYVCHQLCAGGLVLAAFFLAPEMTSRPVTPRGQFIFGAGAGALAMLLQLYVDTPIPAYLAVLAMNTLTPAIEAVSRPRVLGAPRWPWGGKRRGTRVAARAGYEISSNNPRSRIADT